MLPRTLLASMLFLCASAFAQSGERAPRPESASNARVGGWCDALTGEKKEQCLRDERRKKKRSAPATEQKQAIAKGEAKPTPAPAD